MNIFKKIINKLKKKTFYDLSVEDRVVLTSIINMTERKSK